MSNKINERQRLAAQLAASGKTGREIAAELDVAPETVSRWRSDEHFAAELNAFRNDAVDAACFISAAWSRQRAWRSSFRSRCRRLRCVRS